MEAERGQYLHPQIAGPGLQFVETSLLSNLSLSTNYKIAMCTRLIYNVVKLS
jgi:hypothetical protein